jgi:hypothetical protein
VQVVGVVPLLQHAAAPAIAAPVPAVPPGQLDPKQTFADLQIASMPQKDMLLACSLYRSLHSSIILNTAQGFGNGLSSSTCNQNEVLYMHMRPDCIAIEHHHATCRA